MPGLTSEELTTEVRRLREKLEHQAEARHAANEELNAIVMQFSNDIERLTSKTETSEAAIRGLSAHIQPLLALAGDIKAIHLRLIGDPNLQSIGLIQQHLATATELTSLRTLAEKNENAIRWMKRERLIVVSTLGSLGAIVTFVKGTAIVKWLSTP